MAGAGISPFPGTSEEEQENERLDRRLLYVGMTRAESFLAITASGQSPYVADIANSPARVVVRSAKGAGVVKVAE